MAEFSFYIRVKNLLRQGLASAESSLKGFLKNTGALMAGFLGLASAKKLFGSLGDLIDRVKELKSLGGETKLIGDEALSQLDEANNRLENARDKITAGIANGLAIAVDHLRTFGAILGALSVNGFDLAQAMSDAAEAAASDDPVDTMNKEIELLKDNKKLQEEIRQEEEKKLKLSREIGGELAKSILAKPSEQSAENKKTRQEERNRRVVLSRIKHAEEKRDRNLKFGRDAEFGMSRKSKQALELGELMDQNKKIGVSSDLMTTEDQNFMLKLQLKELKDMNAALQGRLRMK